MANQQRPLLRSIRKYNQLKGLTWSPITLPTILGVGLRTWSAPNSKTTLHGASRLWRILISESAFLIWRLRCERVIQHADNAAWAHSPESVARSWKLCMERRLRIDILCSRRTLGISSVSPERVLSTWHRVIEDELGLHHSGDWTLAYGVLVGISRRVHLDTG